MVHAKTLKVKCVLWKEKQNGVISVLFSQSVKYVAALFLLLYLSINFSLFLSDICGTFMDFSYQEQFQIWIWNDLLDLCLLIPRGT